MKALVIAPQPFFSPRGTPFSVYYRTCVTAQLGVSVDLLTYGEGQDVDLPGVRIIRIPRLRWLGPIPIGPSPVKAVLDVFMLLWTVALLLRHRYDFVHAHEEAVFWCRYLKPIFRFKLVYDMHSSLPQQLTNFKFTQSRFLIGAFEALERSALRAADAVITICPDLRDYALKQGVPAERHFLIENSIFDDVRVKQAATGATGVAEPTMPDRTGPRVVYAGTFESYQGLDILIHAFERVTRERPDAQLVMVGGTNDQVAQLRELANRASLGERCVFTGRVPKSQAMKFLDTADVLVSPRREGTNTPLKVYEQLASGKPLVATNIWSHTQVLSEEVCFLVDPEPASMARGILEAINEPERRRRVVHAAQQLYQVAYSRHAYETKMRQLLEVVH